MQKNLYPINCLYNLVLMNHSTLAASPTALSNQRSLDLSYSAYPCSITFRKGQMTPGPHKLHTAIVFSLLPAHPQSRTAM
jgi:hypothetical protein